MHSAKLLTLLAVLKVITSDDLISRK